MTYRLVAGTVLVACWGVAPAMAERIDRGSQVIDGTSVRTTVYHERGYAEFSNSCGTQRLTQSQLQSGAKPYDIIPCPRRSPSTARPAPSGSGSNRQWSAVAAGIQEGGAFGRSRVSVGYSRNNSSRAAAEAAAIRTCEENIPSCRAVTAWNSGCYYITVSKGGSGVAWGSGPTAQAAYDACYARIASGNCDGQTLGGCQ